MTLNDQDITFSEKLLILPPHRGVYYLWNKDDQQRHGRTKDDNTADEYVQRGRIFAYYETYKNTDGTQYYDVVNTDTN